MKRTVVITTVITISLFGLALATGCSKKDNNSPSQSSLLIAGKWQEISDVETWTDSTGSHSLDNYATEPPCDRDDFFTFAANGIVTTDEGPTKCDPTDPQTITDNWQLLNNNKQLAFTTGGYTVIANIITLNSTTLSLQTIDSSITPVDIKTATYKNIK